MLTDMASEGYQIAYKMAPVYKVALIQLYPKVRRLSTTRLREPLKNPESVKTHASFGF